MEKTTSEDFVLYIGSKYRYSGPQFTRETLIKAIREFQEEHGIMCLSLTDVFYLAGDFEEGGWAIRLINYGRFQKSFKERHEYMQELSKYLLHKFNQNRVSLVGPHTTTMWENENAETTHKQDTGQKA